MSILDILGTIGFDWRVAIVNLVSFLIIFLILKKFVFDHIAKVIRERRATIASGLNQAEEAESILADAEVAAEDITREARLEGQEIIAASKTQAETLAQEIAERSQNEAEKTLEQARERSIQETEALRTELRKEMADLVVQSVQTITAEELTSERHQEYAARAAELVAQK